MRVLPYRRFKWHHVPLGAARSADGRELEPAALAGLGVFNVLTVMTLGGFAMEVRRSFDALTGLVDVLRAELE